jgi:hypothetical protein
MSSPADSATNPVSILLPIYFDVSGLDAQLFGQEIDVSGEIIRVCKKLPVGAFYTSENDALISFRQNADEDIFEVDIAASNAGRIAQDISASLHLVEGTTYDVAKRGFNELDCSGVSGFSNTGAFDSYYSIQDFVLSYFAYKVLGHPGALAAISNDASIRASGTSIFAAANFATKLSSAAKTEGTMTDNDAKAVVQQVMNQDLARFNLIDKRADGYTPLPFAAGDKVYVQIRMSNNTYSLKQSVANPTTITTGIVSSANASASGTPSAIPSEFDQYLLEFELGTTAENRWSY